MILAAVLSAIGIGMTLVFLPFIEEHIFKNIDPVVLLGSLAIVPSLFAFAFMNSILTGRQQMVAYGLLAIGQIIAALILYIAAHRRGGPRRAWRDPRVLPLLVGRGDRRDLGLLEGDPASHGRAAGHGPATCSTTACGSTRRVCRGSSATAPTSSSWRPSSPRRPRSGSTASRWASPSWSSSCRLGRARVLPARRGRLARGGGPGRADGQPGDGHHDRPGRAGAGARGPARRLHHPARLRRLAARALRPAAGASSRCRSRRSSRLPQRPRPTRRSCRSWRRAR